LFKFPTLLAVRMCAFKSVAQISLMVVLPALPVVASKVFPQRRRAALARLCKAASTSGTTNAGAPQEPDLLTTSAAAPRALPQVPTAAVERRDGRDVVWIVADDRVERRAVRLGGQTTGGVLISAGLSGNERLVTDVAGLNLSDGARVRVIDP